MNRGLSKEELLLNEKDFSNIGASIKDNNGEFHEAVFEWLKEWFRFSIYLCSEMSCTELGLVRYGHYHGFMSNYEFKVFF